jgi:hypothetical protein
MTEIVYVQNDSIKHRKEVRTRAAALYVTKTLNEQLKKTNFTGFWALADNLKRVHDSSDALDEVKPLMDELVEKCRVLNIPAVVSVCYKHSPSPDKGDRLLTMYVMPENKWPYKFSQTWKLLEDNQQGVTISTN